MTAGKRPGSQETRRRPIPGSRAEIMPQLPRIPPAAAAQPDSIPAAVAAGTATAAASQMSRVEGTVISAPAPLAECAEQPQRTARLPVPILAEAAGGGPGLAGTPHAQHPG